MFKLLLQIWGVCASLLVATSILAQSMMSLSSFQRPFEGNEAVAVNRMGNLIGLQNATDVSVSRMKSLRALVYTDAACLVILTCEFIVLIIVCPRKRQFVCSVISIAPTIEYVSYWIGFIMAYELENMTSKYVIGLFVILQYISNLKICRLFFVTRHIPSIRVIGLTFSTSKKELAIFVFVLTLLVCVFWHNHVSRRVDL